MKSLIKHIIIQTLQWEAKMVLKRYKPKIVAITGTVGKTSTKDAIYTALASALFVRKSEKSFNGDIGVPLTILGLPNAWNNIFLWIENIIKGFFLAVGKYRYPEWLVLEIGADRPDDIKKICQWIKPDVSVITAFGVTPVHVEFFESKEKLIEEKSYVAQALKTNGVLILNGDDHEVMQFKKFAQGTARKVMVVSAHDEQKKRDENMEIGEITSSHPQIIYETNLDGVKMPTGFTFKINYGSNSIPVVRKGIIGRHHIYPTLQAIAVAASQGINLVDAVEALSQQIPTSGRMRLIEGNKGSLIIDDSYNSSPIALKEALSTLKQVGIDRDSKGSKKGRKIAILGDMMELGKHSTEEHENAGQHAGEVCDLLVTVGVRARSIADGALDAGLSEGSIFQFDYSKEAGDFLDPLLKAGDIVLVKGSQSGRMERAVESIMAHPEDKEKLLVRQDKEWVRR